MRSRSLSLSFRAFRSFRISMDLSASASLALSVAAAFNSSSSLCWRALSNRAQAKERIMKIKRDTVKLVEMMIEERISNDWFLQNCGLLCQDDYQDVVQERSIENLCGYPLCDKPLGKILKQKYHISKATNKVYDLTERKCFCSNECYKASNFIKAQLPQLPLYMRKNDTSIKIEIIQDSTNRGSAGDEIVFDHCVSKDEIERLDAERSVHSDHLSNILQQDLKGCEDQLSKLEITENIFEEPYIFDKDNESKKCSDKRKDSPESSDSEESDDSEEERQLFPVYDNISVLSSKHMPIPNQTKRTVLIEPMKASTISKPQSSEISIEFFLKIFQDWFTEDTMKYLLGRKEFYSAKADILFKTMTDETASAEKVNSAKSEYVDLCLKIDKLQYRDHSSSDEFEICSTESTCKTTSKNEECFVIQTNEKRIPKRKPKENRKTKTVKFATVPDVKEKKPLSVAPVLESNSEANEVLPERAFPLIDGLSQNTLQRQVLISKLKSVYHNILPIIDLQYRNIREGVHKLIETYSLTSKNVVFKPKELKVIAIIIFRILCKTTFSEFASVDVEKLCSETIATLKISVIDIDTLVSTLVSKEHLQKIQSSHL